MERRAWLDERRAIVRATYDREGPTYDRPDVPIGSTHRKFVTHLVETCPPGGIVLDAPCGSGKYFALVAGGGRRVVGIDQSAGMLARARARGIAAKLEQIGLQELSFEREFDATMTIDSMEHVPPEDWSAVLANLHRAVRFGGHLYLTVEEAPAAEIERAQAENAAAGLPTVRGEIVEGDVAGYHYYPGREQVLRWLDGEGLSIVEEDLTLEDVWGYRHFLARSP